MDAMNVARGIGLAVLLASCGTEPVYSGHAQNAGVAYVSPGSNDTADPSEAGSLTYPLDVDLTYQAGTPLFVETLVTECAEDAEATCSVRLHGSDLWITSSFAWNDTCLTREVPRLAAWCASPRLTAGSYTVHYGSDTSTLEIPATRPVVQLAGD